MDISLALSLLGLMSYLRPQGSKSLANLAQDIWTATLYIKGPWQSLYMACQNLQGIRCG